jgi:hypothetical protein
MLDKSEFQRLIKVGRMEYDDLVGSVLVFAGSQMLVYCMPCSERPDLGTISISFLITGKSPVSDKLEVLQCSASK